MKFKKLPSDKKYDGATSPPPMQGRYDHPLGAWEAQRAMMTCLGCSTPYKEEAFLKVPPTALGYMGENGTKRMFLCRSCLEGLAKKFVEEDPNQNPYRALYKLCAFTGVYYDNMLAHQVIEGPNTWEDGTPVSPFIHWSVLYCRAVMADNKLKTKGFYDSDNFDYDVAMGIRKVVETNELSEHDKQNRASIIAIYHYDPFEDEAITDRSKMYEDLMTLASDDIAEDLVKQKAALEIVRSFNRINKINDALIELQATTDSMTNNTDTIKALMEQKNKETSTVLALSKDNGFTEKYASSKTKGSGTLSAIVRDMEEHGYDPGIANKFDIETEKAMQQVADISATAVFKQLSFTETDYAAMVREQGEYIREMQDTMARQAEELRLLKEKQLKQEILEEYKRELEIKGLDHDEIEALVRKELDYKPKIVGNTLFSQDDIRKEPEYTMEELFGG